MGDVEIDVEAFKRHVSVVQAAWKDGSISELVDVDSILIVMGSRQEDVQLKTTAVHYWFLGYEFPATLILLTRNGVTFCTSSSKAQVLDPLAKKQSAIPVNIVRRPKDADGAKAAFKQVVDEIEKAGTKVGVLSKDKVAGKFFDEWKAVYDEDKDTLGIEESNIADVFEQLWTKKDEQEQKYTRLASRFSNRLLDACIDEIQVVLDEGRKMTHEKLSNKIEALIEDDKTWNEAKGLAGADYSLVEIAIPPIVQSGGNYDLKLSALPDTNRLEGADGGGGVVLARLGLRYSQYCSAIARTYLVDPHKIQQKHYETLVALQTEITDKFLVPGATGAEVYSKAVEFVKRKDAKLADSLIKNLGWSTGVEVKGSGFAISANSNRALQADTILLLQVGFTNLSDPNPDHSGKSYTLYLMDTVKVNAEGAASFLTKRTRNANENMFFLNDEKEEGDDSPAKSKAPRESPSKFAEGRKTRNQGRKHDVNESLAMRIKPHQKELAEAKHEEGLTRFANEEGGEGKDKGKIFKKFEAYKKGHDIPSKVKDLRIHLDSRTQTLLLPIYGFAVPFHINTIKNVSKSDEGEWTYLRINFVSPGQIAGKKEDVPFEDAEATFVRNMTFRSTDTFHFGELHKEITELKKAASKKESEKKEMADVIQQEKLITNKGRAVALADVYPRPALEGKRLSGEVEIHQNGIRFSSPHKDQKIELLFSNMRHLFFQPCDNELIAIIHVHLKSPIMIGKKKAKDVQFYREASDVTFDETGAKKRKYRTGDEDEIELEQEERRRRHQLNKEFKSFANKIAEASDNRVQMDTPMRDLGFMGVPFRTNVNLFPTTECLVHLTDPPFFVVTLADVEVAHLERVAFGLKNFDLVLVLSDFSRPPVHINSIPMTQLDSVKEFLDSVDICVTEGPVNLNWAAIMKTIQEDPYDFFVEGGWGFLGSNDSDAESSDSESASEFDEEEAEDEEGASSSDDDESDFADSDESESGSEVGEDEESGEDWDTLEKKAARADDKRRAEKGGVDSDDEGKKRKRR